MRSRLVRLARRAAILLGVVLLTALAIRAWDSQRGPGLEVWHTHVPTELRAAALATADWAAYLRAEDAAFAEVRALTDTTPAGGRVKFNRYVAASPVYPPRLAHDWNRSFVMEPGGTPAGAVVLLHGLTDSPYSMRHVAEVYRARGWLAIAIRLPGHGTVPAGLTDVEWEDWQAATRLAVREARRRTGPTAPLHLVGYSNGGALALQYALDAIEDARLARPARVVLLAPMIGITRFARFAGMAGWPAILPAFAKAAWLSILPEFNPFKYESFPINGARQTDRLTRVLQAQIARLAAANRLTALPPVLTFQSAVDFTVKTRAIVEALYAFLPSNGSELVVFDVNRTSKFFPLLTAAAETKVRRLLPPPPRAWRSTVVTNATESSSQVVARTTEAGAGREETRPLGIVYPDEVYSLSHVAVPFPPEDGLYGSTPDPRDDAGIQLGTLTARGELGTLVVTPGSSLRMLSNPFFPYVRARIAEALEEPAAGAARPMSPPNSTTSPSSAAHATGH
jgi:alpha-beta hydrolase superfamily lysophospholipase